MKSGKKVCEKRGNGADGVGQSSAAREDYSFYTTSPGTPGAPLFEKTHWSIVELAGQCGSKCSADALVKLCATNRFLMYAHSTSATEVRPTFQPASTAPCSKEEQGQAAFDKP